jgi:broad specificity phosphatase PhoE
LEILLVRHGRPALSTAETITGREIGDFARRYDVLEIIEPPPLHLTALTASCDCIVSSDRPRARDSAKLLASGRRIEIDPELREAALPESIGVPLSLPAGWWVAAARVAWWLNWCSSEESRGEAQTRASRVAERLSTFASAHERVVAVGHGVFNGLVGRALKSRGWRGPLLMPRRCWSAARYVISSSSARP